MPKWIIKRAGKDTAPIEHVKMIELAKLGRIMPTDQVCLEGSNSWMPGHKFADFIGGHNDPSKQTLLELPVDSILSGAMLSDLAEEEKNAVIPANVRLQEENQKKSAARKRTIKLAVLGVGIVAVLGSIYSLTSCWISSNQAASVAKANKANLKAIWLVLDQYAQTHGGLYPHSLGTLVKEKMLDTRQLLNPRMSGAEPTSFNLEELARWADMNAGYCFITSNAPAAELDPHSIVVHERMDDAMQKQVDVLTVAGIVRTMNREEAEALIRASRNQAWQIAKAAQSRLTSTPPPASRTPAPLPGDKTGPVAEAKPTATPGKVAVGSEKLDPAGRGEGQPKDTPPAPQSADNRPSTSTPTPARAEKPTRKQSVVRGLVVREMPDGQLAGMSMEIIATVNSRLDNSSTSSPRCSFSQTVGDQMQIALDEAIRTIKVRHPAWQVADITFSFADKYSPKDGGSAGTAFTILLLSLLENHELDPELAMTGDITVDGKVRKIGGVGAKIRGALLDKCSLVAIPSENEDQLKDVFLIYPPETFWQIQIFGITTMDEALMLASKSREGQLQQAITKFEEFRTALLKTAPAASAPASPAPTSTPKAGFESGSGGSTKAKETPAPVIPAYLYTAEARKQLQEVLALAPNHFSAKYLLMVSTRTMPATLSTTASIHEIIVAINPILGVLLKENTAITRYNLSADCVRMIRSKLDKLTPLLNPEAKPLLTKIRGLISACDAMASLMNGPDSEKTTLTFQRQYETMIKNVNTRRTEVYDAFELLHTDREVIEKITREGY